MDASFSIALTRLRKEAGFKTAYGFYHGKGGRAVFALSYVKYLAIEKGVHLPRPERVNILLSLLGIPLGSPKARELILAWLQTALGEELCASWLSQLRWADAPGPASPDKTLSQTGSARTFCATIAQAEAAMAEPANLLCFTCLSHHEGSCTEIELAEALGLKPGEVRKALDRLVKAKLVERRGKAYSCPLAGRSVDWPPTKILPMWAKMKQALALLRERRRGEVVCERIGMIRADEAALRDFLPMMGEAVSSIKSFETTRRTPHSAVFMAEGRITKLFPF